MQMRSIITVVVLSLMARADNRCGAGRFFASGGEICLTGSSTSCCPCYAGYFCGLDTRADCPMGFMEYGGIRCMSGSCPAGTWSSTVGAQTNATCSNICPAAFFCPIGSSSGTANSCPASYYCPAGSSSGTDNPSQQARFVQLVLDPQRFAPPVRTVPQTLHQ